MTHNQLYPLPQAEADRGDRSARWPFPTSPAPAQPEVSEASKRYWDELYKQYGPSAGYIAARDSGAI